MSFTGFYRIRILWKIKKRHFDHFRYGISWEEKPYGPYETMMVTATRKSNRFDEQNNNSAHASHFFELSLQIRPEMTKF